MAYGTPESLEDVEA
ncbi:Protein of unknown function [Bacillus mycoides]|nr:Protein of unknown function [Bacillus mycoides]